ncbi:MAG: Tm-1-like ATP-binding domain-containing protein [Oscillospiraceae bacterium]
MTESAGFPTIAVMGTFDTKAREYEYLIREIEEQGGRVYTIDLSLSGKKPELKADLCAEDIVASRGIDAEQLYEMPRSKAMDAMLPAAAALVSRLGGENRIHAIISMGGSGGTTLASAIFAGLPLTMPKILISTLAGTSRIGGYVGAQNIMVINPIVDVSGINSITAEVFKQAAWVAVGAGKGAMCRQREQREAQKPVIAATMYGVTTPCITRAKEWLEARGYEVVTFHAVGAGGRAMESLLRKGHFAGVLDITTTELASQVLGSEAGTAGADRLDRRGLPAAPQVVSLGAMDMISVTDFKKFEGHHIYCHNKIPSHVRTTGADLKKVGAYIAEKLNQADCPSVLMVPLKGLSQMDAPGKELYDPEADRVLFDAIRKDLDTEKTELIEMACHINDEEFAVAAAKKLDQLIKMERHL